MTVFLVLIPPLSGVFETPFEGGHQLTHSLERVSEEVESIASFFNSVASSIWSLIYCPLFISSRLFLPICVWNIVPPLYFSLPTGTGLRQSLVKSSSMFSPSSRDADTCAIGKQDLSFTHVVCSFSRGVAWTASHSMLHPAWRHLEGQTVCSAHMSALERERLTTCVFPEHDALTAQWYLSDTLARMRNRARERRERKEMELQLSSVESGWALPLPTTPTRQFVSPTNSTSPSPIRSSHHSRDDEEGDMTKREQEDEQDLYQQALVKSERGYTVVEEPYLSLLSLSVPLLSSKPVWCTRCRMIGQQKLSNLVLSHHSDYRMFDESMDPAYR